MNDYLLRNLVRQREREILEEWEGIRLSNAQQICGRGMKNTFLDRMTLLIDSWKRGICRKASRVRDVMDPLHLKDQKMQNHPEP